jgi:hypothetical protein
MRSQQPEALWATLFATAALLAGGCGGDPPRKDPDTSLANLLGIHTAYVDHVAATRRPPRTIQELEKATAEDDRTALDALFRSPHDRKPYVIVWGILLGPNEPSPPVVLAHEEEGVNVERWVLMSDGTCRRMIAEEFEKAKKPR